jgi:TrmH family RNA methyltransferase
MMDDWKNNISFVLVEPAEPGNIGASARAMKNMGFANLELVTPGNFFTSKAKQMACQGVTVLENTIVHKSFTDAVQDKNLIVGTTKRFGRRRGLIVPLKESVRRIITAAKKNRVAILFGSERNGLTNQQIEECGLLITIPSDPETPSLNLAQSVMLVAYELSQKTYKIDLPALVKHKELGPLYAKIASTLNLLEFIPRGDMDLEKKIMKSLARLIGRAGLTEWELKMLYGLCTQVENRMCKVAPGTAKGKSLKLRDFIEPVPPKNIPKDSGK